MHIGIVTFFWNYNYGAVLQAHALRNTLTNLGHTSMFVNYVPKMLAHHATRGWGLRSGRFCSIAIKRLKFNRFRAKHFDISARCRDVSEISNLARNFDAMIVGSDQVWNSSLLGGFDPVMFLDIPGLPSSRRVSYAPSCGHSGHSTEFCRAAASSLARMGHVSIRDVTTGRMVEEMLGSTPPMVLDPTLLIDDMPCGYVSPRTESYILAYFVDPLHKDAISMIAKFRTLSGLKVVAVSVYADAVNSDILVSSAGIEEWLGWFKNASLIIGDSFHGAIFAMKYKKSFFALATEEKKAARINDLLEQFGLTENLITDLSTNTLKAKIDRPMKYDLVAQKLTEHRAASMEYLMTSLNS